MSELGKPSDAASPTEDLEDLYENAPCGYLSLEPDGRIFKANLTLATWMGFSREQLTEMHFHDLLNMAGRIFFETHFAPLLRLQGSFNEVALDLVTKDRSRLPVLVNAREKHAPDGRHLFTRLTIFNATDRRRYERQLLEARTAAEASEKEVQELRLAEKAVLFDERAVAALREQFIAVLGHDLRNPLSAMTGGMYLLLKTPLNERAKSIIGMMQDASGRMTALIDNVLDFARGRLSGGIGLARQFDVMIEPLLSQVIAELQLTWPARVFETEFAISAPIDCDPARLGQLLSNLLGNALTHGAEDRPIQIKARTEDGVFHLAVGNAGLPIPEKALKQLFEPFFRADVRPSAQGLGLGLYIVSEIARAHGGEIKATSDEEETCFSFSMPCRADQASSQGGSPPRPPPART